jgi:hypothetical protein
MRSGDDALEVAGDDALEVASMRREEEAATSPVSNSFLSCELWALVRVLRPNQPQASDLTTRVAATGTSGRFATSVSSNGQERFETQSDGRKSLGHVRASSCPSYNVPN